jgi:ferric iron reductase protein FhuF
VIPLLAPIFRGELAPLGERLACADTVPADAVCVSDLVGSRARLLDVLQLQARFRHSTGDDLRAVASAWTLDYLEALLPPVVAAASVLHHVFPVEAAQIWLRLDARGGPVSFHIRQLGTARPDTRTAERYAPLLQHHLAPLFSALSSLTRLAPKILWGNAARHLEPILGQALALTGGSEPIAQDIAYLLQSATWPHAAEAEAGEQRTNPLFGRQREIRLVHEGRHTSFRLHRQCCLYYLLPHETHCNACPLSPAYRKGGEEEEEDAGALEGPLA